METTTNLPGDVYHTHTKTNKISENALHAQILQHWAAESQTTQLRSMLAKTQHFPSPPPNNYPICKNTACKVFPVFLKLLQCLAQTKFPPHTMGLLLDGSQAADPGHDRHHGHLSPFAHQEARMHGLLPMPPYLSFLARVLHWKITAEVLQPKSIIAVMLFKNNTRLPL